MRSAGAMTPTVPPCHRCRSCRTASSGGVGKLGGCDRELPGGDAGGAHRPWRGVVAASLPQDRFGEVHDLARGPVADGQFRGGPAVSESCLHRLCPAGVPVRRLGLVDVADRGDGATGAAPQDHLPLHLGQLLRLVDDDVAVHPAALPAGAVGDELALWLRGFDLAEQVGEGVEQGDVARCPGAGSAATAVISSGDSCGANRASRARSVRRSPSRVSASRVGHHASTNRAMVAFSAIRQRRCSTSSSESSPSTSLPVDVRAGVVVMLHALVDAGEDVLEALLHLVHQRLALLGDGFGQEVVQLLGERRAGPVVRASLHRRGERLRHRCGRDDVELALPAQLQLAGPGEQRRDVALRARAARGRGP